MNPTKLRTVEEYNTQYQKDNPQFFTTAKANSDQANTDAFNRVQQEQGTGKQYVAGKGVVPVVSSTNGASTITKNIQEQNNDLLKLQPKITPTTETTKTTKNSAVESIGGLTAEEASATNTDLNNYTFDSTSGYYIPTAKTEAGKLTAQYEQDTKDIKSAFERQIESFDAASRAVVSSIQGMYSSRIQAQQDLNKRSLTRYNTLGIRGGSGRYAPEIQNSILTGEEREGLKRIEAIASEEKEALMRAQQSLTDKKYQAFVEQRGDINTLRKERQAQLEKLQERAIAEKKRQEEVIQKEKDTLNKYKNDTLIDLGKAGVTDINVIEGVKNATDVSEIVKAAGDNLLGGTGIMGEYSFYKKDAIRNNVKPLSFDEYQTRDANRKKSLASAGIAGTNLDPKQQAVFNSIVNKVTASPAIQALDNAGKLRDIVQEIRNNPSDPAQQLNLIYSYIKGLDTDSAVKEGEIELVKSINSYLGKFQLAFDKISSGKPITEEIALQIADSSDSLIKSIENTAKRKMLIYEAQAKQNGTQVFDAWKGFKSTVEESQFNLVNDQVNEEKQLLDYITSNPTLSDKATTLAETIDPTTGETFTSSQVLEFLKQSK